MNIFSFPYLKIKNNLFDLFKRTTINNSNNVRYETITLSKMYEMRLDKLSNDYYGSNDYVEEIMIFNNILNPFSVKGGDDIKMFNIEDIGLLYSIEKDVDEAKNKIVNTSDKNTKIDDKRRANQGLPPTYKNSDIKPVKVNKSNGTIEINNKLS